MKSDIINIDNQGYGFQDALTQTEKSAVFRDLGQKESLQLLLCTEEMLSMAHSVTGEMQASFWLESEENIIELHMTTNTVMDKMKRSLLISSATSRKNEAANSFLGKLRDAFEKAMVADAETTYFELPPELQADLVGRVIDDPEWDRYERSVLFRLADNVKIDIRGGLVHMTVVKAFS